MKKKKSKKSAKTGGIKYDSGKPRVDLVPYELLEEVGMVMGFGCDKYGEANWAKGIHYSRLIAAAERHLGKFKQGIDLDDETNLSHVAHAATNLGFLLWMARHRPDLDNRWVKNIKKGKK